LGVSWDLDALGCIVLVAAALVLAMAAWLYVYETWGRYDQ